VIDPDAFANSEAGRSALRDAARDVAKNGAAVLISTGDARIAETCDRVAILHRGRLVADETPQSLLRRFRRIRYRNEATPTRTDYGNELDAFDAVRVQVRGWGIQAVVGNYSDESFAAFRGMDGVLAAESAPMTLAEVFEALSRAGPPGERGAPTQ